MEPVSGVDRRQFLDYAAKAAGGLLLGGLAGGGAANAQSGAQQSTEWGWPMPYEQISAKSKQWLESKGWWPISAAWIMVWSGEELIGHILQSQKLLEKRGIDVKWQTFVAAGFSNSHQVGKTFPPATGVNKGAEPPCSDLP